MQIPYMPHRASVPPLATRRKPHPLFPTSRLPCAEVHGIGRGKHKETMNLATKTVLLFRNQTTALSFPSLAHYWDNRFAGQVFQDTGLTTPSASGEVVGGWRDRVGNAPLVQNTAGNKPLNRSASGVEFDGSNDTMTATITTLPAGGITVYYRVYPDDFDAVQLHLDWGNLTMYTLQTSGRVQMAHSGVGTIGTSTPGLTVSAVNTVGIRYNPTSGAFRIIINNNAADTGTQARAVSGTGFAVATENGNGSSFPFDGKLLSIALHTTLHTDTEMNNAMAFWRGVA